MHHYRNLLGARLGVLLLSFLGCASAGAEKPVEIVGSESDDLLTLEAGHDAVIYAGGGEDTVQLPLFFSAFELAQTAPGRIEGTFAGRSVILNDVERVASGKAFTTTIPISELVSGYAVERLQKLSDLYLAFFGRAPDIEGLEYWQKRLLEDGLSLGDISERFAQSAEAQALYPADLSSREFVRIIYLNAFSREPDPGGWSFWTGKLDALDSSDFAARGAFVGTVILGAYSDTSGPRDIGFLSNRHEVSLDYVNRLLMAPGEGIDEAITDLLMLVNDDDATVAAAGDLLNYVFTDPTTLTSVMADDRLVNSFFGKASGTPAFATPESTARFLAQATFGVTPDAVQELTGTSVSSWFTAQLNTAPSGYLEILDEYQARLGYLEFNPWNEAATTFAFWRHAIGGEDQLRQRMVYALSQLLVMSNAGGDQLTDIPEATAYHQELLSRHAFGNYRDLLEAITYSPGMGFYLTYMGNQKGDLESGRVPDENYARELLQLFTLGLVALKADGTVATDSAGQPVELYDNDDITGLARVFTGLDRTVTWEDGGEDPAVLQSWREPMVVYPEQHSPLEKTFLGLTIPAGTGAKDSIALALDHLMAHPNVGPFVARQLIQRFTTSSPVPAYVFRVAAAFDAGTFILPDGTRVGEGRKGDLAATVSAILLDPENLQPAVPERYGKVREPVLRLTQWARAFSVSTLTPEYTTELWDLSPSYLFAQHPFRAPSVFNFYRPGYVPPRTESGELGLTVPELQITNASTVPGYLNHMTFFVFGGTEWAELEEYIELAEFAEVDFDPELARESFVPDYGRELALAADIDALIDHLALLLNAGYLSAATREMLVDYLSRVPVRDGGDAGALLRVQLAVMLLLASPDFLVQR